MLTKRWPGIYILYYFNLVEVVISHQKLRLTCRELCSSCTGRTSIKDRSYFAVSSSLMLTGKIFSWIIRHNIITFWGWKPYKKNIKPDHNFLYKGVLNKLQSRRINFRFMLFTKALMNELDCILIHVHKIFNRRVSFKILLLICLAIVEKKL